MRFQVNTPEGPKTIGELKGDRLIKRVSRLKHFHRRTQAWGLQAEAIPRLRELGVATVELRLDTGEILLASLDDYETKGFVLDFGHGKQVFLAERYWVVKEPAALTLF